jgi:hypothetical protein
MRDQYASVLGASVIERWGELPQDIQKKLFEAAVRRGGESMREALASFLHDHHPRTVD